MHRASLPLLSVLLVTTAGCQSEPRTSGVDDGPAPVIVDGAAQKQRRRDASFVAAIDGLDFETGVVVVESPPATDDVEAAGALLREGETLLSSNRRTGAIKSFAGAIKAAPGMDEAYLALGHALVTKGKMDYAYAAFRTVVLRDPSSIEARAALANAYAMRERYLEAIAEMREVVALDPEYGPGHERLAIWSYYQGDLRAAREHLEIARRLDHAVPPQFVDRLEQAGG